MKEDDAGGGNVGGRNEFKKLKRKSDESIEVGGKKLKKKWNNNTLQALKQNGSKRCHVQDLEEGFLEVASLTVAAWVGAWFADAKGWVRGWDLEGGNVDWASVKVGVRAVANDCTLIVDGCKAVLLHQRLRAVGVVWADVRRL